MNHPDQIDTALILENYWDILKRRGGQEPGMTSKSIIQEILNSENSRHSWYEEPESKSKMCTRCHKSCIEEKTRIRIDDDTVIIRMIHSDNFSLCEVEMVGGGGGLL